VGANKVDFGCPYTSLDITDAKRYNELVKDNKIDYIVHLAAILSATGELYPDKALDVNVTGAITAMNIAREVGAKIYLPSSIAVFGGDVFQKDKTPVDSVLQPTTMYGVSKVFNEQLGTYYNKKFGVDFRCIRYPGVISAEKYAFNGTAMYSTRKQINTTANPTCRDLLRGPRTRPLQVLPEAQDFSAYDLHR
jgi:nucleoside-diphosphate-sugar epimerase